MKIVGLRICEARISGFLIDCVCFRIENCDFFVVVEDVGMEEMENI